MISVAGATVAMYVPPMEGSRFSEPTGFSDVHKMERRIFPTLLYPETGFSNFRKKNGLQERFCFFLYVSLSANNI
jgi:hypothetical protein